jgi:hypothetical protein
MQFVALVTLTCTIALAAPALAAESVLAHYRGVTLGESVTVIVDRLKLVAADVKVVHERPELIQELTWRPRPMMSGANHQPDSVSEIILTFRGGHLARIAVLYDRVRTQGLTNADLLEAMTGAYGTSMLIGTPTQPASGLVADRQVIGRWEDAETLLVLWREQFPNRVGLVITSIESDAAFQHAITEGVRLHAAEGPARDLARRTAEAAAIQIRDEKIRKDNKTAFKPN